MKAIRTSLFELQEDGADLVNKLHEVQACEPEDLAQHAADLAEIAAKFAAEAEHLAQLTESVPAQTEE